MNHAEGRGLDSVVKQVLRPNHCKSAAQPRSGNRCLRKSVPPPPHAFAQKDSAPVQISESSEGCDGCHMSLGQAPFVKPTVVYSPFL